MDIPILLEKLPPELVRYIYDYVGKHQIAIIIEDLTTKYQNDMRMCIRISKFAYWYFKQYHWYINAFIITYLPYPTVGRKYYRNICVVSPEIVKQIKRYRESIGETREQAIARVLRRIHKRLPPPSGAAVRQI